MSFAVGAYLPIATTAPIFAGGLVRWWVERRSGVKEESDLGAGTLFSSGLIAGGSICGILFAVLVGTETIGPFQAVGNALPWLHDETRLRADRRRPALPGPCRRHRARRAAKRTIMSRAVARRPREHQ